MDIKFNDLLRRNKKTLEKEKSKVEKQIQNINASNEFEETNKRLQESEFESKVEDVELEEGNRSLKKTLTSYLTQIKQALKFINHRKYGVCQRCGKKISADRLAANPAAIYCVDCAAIMEENETA